MYLFKMDFLLSQDSALLLTILWYTFLLLLYLLFKYNLLFKILLNKSRKNDAKVVVLPKERQQKARAALLNCISALVCQDTQESVALGRVLNPQCTPTGPSRSLHARAVAALFACSHSICTYLVLSA